MILWKYINNKYDISEGTSHNFTRLYLYILYNIYVYIITNKWYVCCMYE